MKLKIYLTLLFISLVLPSISHAKCFYYVDSQKPYSQIFDNFDISSESRDGRCNLQEYILGLVSIYEIKNGVLHVFYTEKESDYPITSVRNIYPEIFPGKEIIIGDRIRKYEDFYARFIATHYRKYLNKFYGIAGQNVLKRSNPKVQTVKDRDFFVVKLELNCNDVMCDELEDQIQKDAKMFLNNIPTLIEINLKVKIEKENAVNQINFKIKEMDLKIKELRSIASNDLVSQALNYAGGVREDSSGFFFYYPVKKDANQCVYGKITDPRVLSENERLGRIVERLKNVYTGKVFPPSIDLTNGELNNVTIDLTKGDLNNVTFYEVRGVNPNDTINPGPYLKFQSNIDGVNENFECDSKTCSIERLRRAWKLVASNCKSAKKAF